MAQVEATTERVVAADAEAVFDALADYSGTRAKVLPEQFSEYEVREGGDGEGTLVHWKLQATSKRVRDCLLEVSEPTDGELVEKDRNSTMVTTWRVTPAGEGKSRVVVTSTWNGATGIGGFFERT
ncbi:SRPBCC family protein, partial [Streptomyces prunicolor]